MSSLQRKAVTGGMPRGLPPRCPMGRDYSGGRGSARGSARGGRGGRNKVYTPIHWKKYFKNCHKIQVGTSTFNAYQGLYSTGVFHISDHFTDFYSRQTEIITVS